MPLHLQNKPIYNRLKETLTPKRVGEKALVLINEYRPPTVDWAPPFWWKIEEAT